MSMATSWGDGPPEVCFGFGIHRSLLLNHRFSPGMAGGIKDLPEVYFSPRNREQLGHYVKDSLIPLAEVLSGWLDQGVHATFSVSGTLCELLSRFEPEMLDLLCQLASHRNSEFLGETYYRSVAGLFPDLSEFEAQVRLHSRTLEELFGVTSRVFDNTNISFNPALVPVLKNLGFLAVYTEGFDRFFSDMNTDLVYSCGGMAILTTNCSLSDDIAIRFFLKEWDQYPLSPERYAGWIAASPGRCVHIFLDGEIFSRPAYERRDLAGFFSRLPEALQEAGVKTCLPSNVAGALPERELPIRDPGLRTLNEPCTLGGMTCIMQHSAFFSVMNAGPLRPDPSTWRNLQADDHFRHMEMKSVTCGRRPHFMSNQEVFEYFTTYMRILSHCEEVAANRHRYRKAARTLRCLPPEKAFHFSTGDRPTGFSAYSLDEFARMLTYTPDQVFAFHQERHDFARWIREVLEDPVLAGNVDRCVCRDEIRECVEQRAQQLWNRVK
jgi:alpha-amylase